MVIFNLVYPTIKCYSASTADVGAVFSGADIVQWMVRNVEGVDSERDAEMLGQLLLNRGAIFHSEGSR